MCAYSVCHLSSVVLFLCYRVAISAINQPSDNGSEYNQLRFVTRCKEGLHAYRLQATKEYQLMYQNSFIPTYLQKLTHFGRFPR